MSTDSEHGLTVQCRTDNGLLNGEWRYATDAEIIDAFREVALRAYPNDESRVVYFDAIIADVLTRLQRPLPPMAKGEV